MNNCLKSKTVSKSSGKANKKKINAKYQITLESCITTLWQQLENAVHNSKWENAVHNSTKKKTKQGGEDTHKSTEENAVQNLTKRKPRKILKKYTYKFREVNVEFKQWWWWLSSTCPCNDLCFEMVRNRRRCEGSIENNRWTLKETEVIRLMFLFEI